MMQDNSIDNKQKNLAELLGFSMTSAVAFGVSQVFHRYEFMSPSDLKLRTFGITCASNVSLGIGVVFFGMSIIKMIDPNEYQILKRKNEL
jgi:hypothetical protein